MPTTPKKPTTKKPTIKTTTAAKRETKTAAKLETKTAPKLGTKPVAKRETKTAPKPATKTTPQRETKTAATLKTKPAATLKTKPAPKLGTKPAPKLEPKPAPTLTTKTVAKPATKTTPKPATKTVAKLDPKPTPNLKTKPTPKLDPKPTPETKPETDPKPTPETKPKPETETNPTSETETAYTLPALLARSGAAAITDDDVFFYIDAPRSELVELGTQVRTERIDVDAARIYGTALDVFEGLTPAQKVALPGLSRRRLQVSIRAAARGQELNRKQISAVRAAATSQGLRTLDARELKQSGRGLRKVLRATLLGLAGGHAQRTEEIRRAYGRGGEAAELRASLGELAALLDRYQKDKDPKIAARRAELALDGGLVARAREIAAELATRGAAENAPRTATPGSEVDLWDGVNLVLLEQLITLFEAGHELERTVPRLVPLALRGYFGRPDRPDKKEPGAPAPAADAPK